MSSHFPLFFAFLKMATFFTCAHIFMNFFHRFSRNFLTKIKENKQRKIIWMILVENRVKIQWLYSHSRGVVHELIRIISFICSDRIGPYQITWTNIGREFVGRPRLAMHCFSVLFDDFIKRIIDDIYFRRDFQWMFIQMSTSTPSGNTLYVSQH